MKKSYDSTDMIGRAIIAFGCDTLSQLADLFNISPQDLSNRKRKGTHIRLIEKEAYKRNINYHWIKTGQGNMRSDNNVAEPYTPYNAKSSAPKISELLSKTAAVLESPTIFSSALKSNIDAFHHALHCEQQLAIAIQRIEDLEEWKKSVEKRLPAVVNGS